MLGNQLDSFELIAEFRNELTSVHLHQREAIEEDKRDNKRKPSKP